MNKSISSSRFVRSAASNAQPKPRLMLGITARQIRSGTGATFSTTPRSGRLFGASLLDRLQPTLTRYHD